MSAYRFRSVLAAVGLVFMPTCELAQAQSSQCETSKILIDNKEGRIIACSQLLNEVPALIDAVRRLNETAAKDAEARRDVDRFIRSLNETSGELPPKYQSQLAQSISDRVIRAQAGGVGRVARDVERIRVDLEDMREKIAEVRSSTGEEGTRNALGGPTGAAIAALDFNQAKQIIDELSQIKAQTAGPYTAAPQEIIPIRDEVNRAKQRLVSAGAAERCPEAWKLLLSSIESADQVEKRNQHDAAAALFQNIQGRAAILLAELQYQDMAADAPRQQYAAARANIENMLNMQRARFENRKEQRQLLAAVNPSYKQDPRPYFDDVSRLLSEADALAKTGKYGDANAKLTDASDALWSAMFGTGYKAPRYNAAPLSMPNVFSSPQCR
jgi:hypothetical protein